MTNAIMTREEVDGMIEVWGRKLDDIIRCDRVWVHYRNLGYDAYWHITEFIDD